MIKNATILRIDQPGAASVTGDVPLTQGSAIAARCQLVQVEAGQTLSPSSDERDFTAILTVLKATYLGTGVRPLVGQVWTVQIDRNTYSTAYVVRSVGDNGKANAMANWNIKLKAA